MSDQLQSELLAAHDPHDGRVPASGRRSGAAHRLCRRAVRHTRRARGGGRAAEADRDSSDQRSLPGDLRRALAVTNEFRYGTIRPTLLFEPRRRVVLAAKLAAGALVGIFLAVACVAVSFGAGLALLSARDVEIALTLDQHARVGVRDDRRERPCRDAGCQPRGPDPQSGGRHHRPRRLLPRCRHSSSSLPCRRSAAFCPARPPTRSPGFRKRTSSSQVSARR